MAIRSIFLMAPAETSDPARGAVACAIDLARQHEAHLTVFCVALDVTTPGRHVDAEPVAAAIRAAAATAGVAVELITQHSHAVGLPQVVAEYARLHDVSVTGSSGEGLLSERLLAEHLLFDSGRPLLLVPPTWTGTIVVDRAAIAWDNSAAAARALGDAIALFDVRNVALLAIEGDKPFGMGIERAVVIAMAARRGLTAELVSADLAGRSIATALQQEAGDAGLLAMGGFGHSRLRRFILGSATAGVLAHPTMPILLAH